MAVCPDLPPRGFSFDNCKRNAGLEAKGFKAAGTVKTGTTIVGVLYNGGVILAADTRATGGQIVSDKYCQKLHQMSKKIYCAGAGTAADCDQVTRMIASQIALLELNSGRSCRVATVTRILKQYLYRYQGYIGAALIIGGIDALGPHLYELHPRGNVTEAPYLTMGSGSLAGVAVLERDLKFDMDLESAKKLARNAVAAGILNDMGSGSQVNLAVLTSKGCEVFSPYELISKGSERNGVYGFAKGTTMVLKTEINHFEIEKEEVRSISAEEEPMDI